MADDNPTADGPSSTDTEEDDPWADVAGEDELRDRALNESSYGDGSDEDADDTAGIDAYAADEDDDADPVTEIRTQAGAAVADAQRVIEACDGDHPETDILQTIAEQVEERIDSVAGMDPEQRENYHNAVERLEDKTERVREEFEDMVEPESGTDGGPDDPGTFDPAKDPKLDGDAAATDGGGDDGGMTRRAALVGSCPMCRPTTRRTVRGTLRTRSPNPSPSRPSRTATA